MRHDERWIAACFFAGVVITLGSAGYQCIASDVRSLAATLQDDSYYYLLPAFRWGTDHCWTFDGEHPTYGFQWLFTLLLSIPSLVVSDRETFLRVSVLLSHVLFSATGIALVWTMRRAIAPLTRWRTVIPWLAGSFWLFDTQLHLAHTTLKENSLYTLLLVLSLGHVLVEEPDQRMRKPVLVGALVTLPALVRLTPSALAVALTSLWIVIRHQDSRVKTRCLLGSSAVALPWLLGTWVMFGRIIPMSGSVKTEWINNAWRDGTLGSHLVTSAAEVPGYLWNAVRFAVGQPHRMVVPQWWTHADEQIGLVSWVKLLLILLAFLRFGRVAGRASALAATAWVLLAASLICTATNPLSLDAANSGDLLRYSTWYIAAEPVLLTILAVSTLVPSNPGHAVVRQAESRSRFHSVFWVAAPAFLLLGVESSIAFGRLPSFEAMPDNEIHQAIVATELANTVLPSGARVGAWNAGVVGWFSRHRVTNLDGLANDDVVLARRSGVPVFEYMKQNRLDYFIDVLPPRGWFGTNVLDRVELLAKVPCRIEGYDGIYLGKVVDERFPDFEESPTGCMMVVPILDPGPEVGSKPRARNFRCVPDAAGPAATIRFFTGAHWQELQCEALCDGEGELEVRCDGESVFRKTIDCTPCEVRIAIHETQLLEVVVRGAPGWVQAVRFLERTDLPPRGRSGSGTYGVGFGPGGVVPTVSYDELRVAQGVLDFRVAGIPDGTSAVILLSARADSKRGPGGGRQLVELPALLVLPVTREGSEWKAETSVRSLSGLETVHAQLVCLRDGLPIAASCGIRLRLR